MTDITVNLDSNHLYALEVQSSFSEEIINGNKSIETREYPLPLALINQPILLLESEINKFAGVSALCDTVTCEIAKANNYKLRVIGIIHITECFQYSSEEEWNIDREHHLVPLQSGFDWSDLNKQGIKRKYGWRITKRVKFDTSKDIPNIMVRVYRSLFDCGMKSDLIHDYLEF